MKNFIFFEATEGGMDITENISSSKNLFFISSWMNGKYKKGDKKMIIWMDTALVGQKYNHRMGYLVRLINT